MNGLLFGPGLAENGTPAQFEVNSDGLRFATSSLEVGHPSWRDIRIQKSGWDGSQLRLEWHGSAGAYALVVAEAAAVKSILAAGKLSISRAPGAAQTRAWASGIVVFTFVVPLLVIAAILWQHETIAGWLVGFISVEQEQKLGAHLFEGQKAKLKKIDGAPATMVRDIGARLTKGSAYRYEFYVSDDKTVNAYAMPGGYIVMHSGLLQLAASADEVAGVLAHEVAHVEKRHSLTAIARQLGLTAVLSLAFGDLGSIASAAGDLLSLKFSRDHEREADSVGLNRLVVAGMQPTAMATFFRKMAAQDKINLGFLSTHPSSEERFSAIDGAIGALPAAARGVPALDYDYAAIKAELPQDGATR